jgi:hypothetical protein
VVAESVRGVCSSGVAVAVAVIPLAAAVRFLGISGNYSVGGCKRAGTGTDGWGAVSTCDSALRDARAVACIQAILQLYSPTARTVSLRD